MKSVKVSPQEVVLFLQNQFVCKELHFSDFKEIISGKKSYPEFALKTIKSAYIQVNQQFDIVAMVLFKLDFDSDGNALESFNLPLQVLAQQTGLGPRLAGQRFRLACRSQCPISWHQHALWDPIDNPLDELKAMKSIVKLNRLHLFNTKSISVMQKNLVKYNQISNQSQKVQDYENQVERMAQEIVDLKQQLFELKNYKTPLSQNSCL